MAMATTILLISLLAMPADAFQGPSLPISLLFSSHAISPSLTSLRVNDLALGVWQRTWKGRVINGKAPGGRQGLGLKTMAGEPIVQIEKDEKSVGVALCEILKVGWLGEAWWKRGRARTGGRVIEGKGEREREREGDSNERGTQCMILMKIWLKQTLVDRRSIPRQWQPKEASASRFQAVRFVRVRCCKAYPYFNRAPFPPLRPSLFLAPFHLPSLFPTRTRRHQRSTVCRNSHPNLDAALPITSSMPLHLPFPVFLSLPSSLQNRHRIPPSLQEAC
eukprot:2114000-Rhodomonas_salina.2